MKGQLKVSTPAQYIAKLAEPRKTEIAALDRFIRKATKLKPYIYSGMISYGQWRFKYAGGREADWPRFCLASNANYISLYVSASDAKGVVIHRYKKTLPKANIGGCCVRFKHLADLDQAVLKRILHEAAQVKQKL